MLFAVFTYQNMAIKTYKELLGTASHKKNHINTVRSKSASKDSLI